MGLVQRDGINRLRHAKRYSNHFGSFCTNMAWTGFTMGAGALRGPDPREMAKSDCVVIWGTNAVSTQVNVMTHAIRARKERGAKIVVVDIYDNPTMKQADVKILVKPGTDGAFACAVMHVLFREGLADRDYLNKFSDDPAGLESHLQGPAHLSGRKRSVAFPHGRNRGLSRVLWATQNGPFSGSVTAFTRQRNGVVNMHAALSLAVCHRQLPA
jgi:anaerobic selenocysteine-containing dehydrogenase